MNQDNNNFMDSRTLLAILLVGLVWFGWQQFISKKYGDQNQLEKVESNVAPTTKESVNTTVGGLTKESGNPDKNVTTNQLESLNDFANNNFKLKISSKGMSLKNVELLQFKDFENATIKFSGGEQGMFSTIIDGNILDFQISKKDENTFVGVAEYKNAKVTKKLTFTNGYNLNIESTIESAQGALPNIEVNLEEEIKKHTSSSIFAPATDHQDVVVLGGEGEKDFNVSSGKDDYNEVVKQATLASVNGHYFSASYIDKSDLLPNFSINHKASSPFVRGRLVYNPSADLKTLSIKSIAYIGPKDISVLESVDPNLLKVVKFGFFSFIAKPLLLIMKWFNSFLGNWGWSIILLTLFVRMIVMPLHIMSFKSMKAMQKVQPMIQNLRERYKDDPMTLNKEMMALMKKHKVNPMGGCLPMLLQIPVFFALYRVFSESIELYRAPFIFWIHDLSLKDPYYVLPVLMATVMYLQQKMTPSTMDPAQAKIMQFMPLVFSFMMISLPSALTLYMFVSTLFGIIQQYLILKDKNAVEIAQKA